MSPGQADAPAKTGVGGCGQQYQRATRAGLYGGAVYGTLLALQHDRVRHLACTSRSLYHALPCVSLRLLLQAWTLTRTNLPPLRACNECFQL